MLEELLAVAYGAMRSRARPTLTGLWLCLAAAPFCLLGGLYLSYAVFAAFEQRLGPPLAGVLTGGLLLLLAGLLLLWALLLRRRPPPRVNEEADIAEALARLGNLIGHRVGTPSASMAITAVLAGLAVGISPSARGFLLNLAEQLLNENVGERQ